MAFLHTHAEKCARMSFLGAAMSLKRLKKLKNHIINTFFRKTILHDLFL